MKTTGAVNWPHALSWLSRHVKDAERQNQLKAALKGKRLQRKISKAVQSARRSNEKGVDATVVRMTRSPDARELSVDGSFAKFPPIGLGCIYCLEQPIGPMQPGAATLGTWVRRGTGDLEQVLRWKESMLQWHAGYLSSKLERYRDGSAPGESDERLLEGTATTPQWDSDALSEATKAGEITATHFLEFLDRIIRRFQAQERLISCGAARHLRLVGVNVHPQDGTLHFHPLFLRTEPIGFLRRDGTIVPAAQAPLGGRRKKGEGWTGGQRCGLIGAGGKLVSNTLGVAMCAADAEESVGIAPAREHGTGWDFLDAAIRVREKGEFVEGGKRGKRERSQGLGTPYDLEFSRIVRDEIAALAALFPKFAARRQSLINQARAKRIAENQAVVAALAQPEIDAARAEGEQAGRASGVSTETHFAELAADSQTFLAAVEGALGRCARGEHLAFLDKLLIEDNPWRPGRLQLSRRSEEVLEELMGDSVYGEKAKELNLRAGRLRLAEKEGRPVSSLERANKPKSPAGPADD